MGKILNSEIYKLIHGKAMYFIMLVGIFFGFCTAVTIWTQYEQADWKDFDFGRAMYDNSTVGVGYVMILLLVIVATFVATEFSNDTAKNIFFVGTSRVKFIISKMIISEVVLFITVVVLFLAQYITLVIMAGDQIHTGVLSCLKILVLLAVKLNLICLSNVMLTVFFACLTQNLVSTIALGYVVNILRNVIILVIEIAGAKKLVKYVFPVRMRCLMSQSYDKELYIAFIAALAWTVLIGAGTSLYFRKKDLSAH